jgi:2-keto-4-pentenoate hydratase/2-oxohepta-3-ene-1,7-dioic acid hydratase in catechol pathway
MIPMAHRYVRVKNLSGQIFYGLLEIDRRVALLDAPPWLGGQVTGEVLAADEHTLLAPCAPSKIIGIGLNYVSHAREMGQPLPAAPLLFLKPTTTVIADRGQITYPHQSQQVDYEGELAIVIGSRTKNCALEDAHRQIWGYTIGNDVTARDLQRIDNQWVRAKGFDTFCPLGPWIVREISPTALLQTRLNDRLVQSSPISDMVFSPDAIVAYVSQIMTLLPGDVILTGTPAGIGPMQVGDRVQIEIEGLGILENRMI